MKKRLIAYDVLRIAAALMVLCFHFDAAVPQYIDAPTYPSPFVTGLGTHLLGGNVAVCIFFMLSGALSAKDIERDSFDVVAYWRKRASRLFVPFFLSWFLVVFARYLFQRRPFMGIPKSRLLLTATGLDGYLTGFGVSCFGLVGEWFFGALVIVTAIWPVVRWALSRRYVPTLLALVVLELAAFGVCQAFIGDQGRAVMIAWRLPTTCLASYAAGAALLRFCGRLREGRPAVVRYGMVALLLLAGALFPYGTAWGNIGYQLAAAGFFCTATFLQADVGKLLEGGGIGHGRSLPSRLVVGLSNLTMYVFMFQRAVIYAVLDQVGAAVGDRAVGLGDTSLVLAVIIAMTFLFAFLALRLEKSICRYFAQIRA